MTQHTPIYTRDKIGDKRYNINDIFKVIKSLIMMCGL